MQPTETTYEVWLEKLKKGWQLVPINGEPCTAIWKEAKRIAHSFVNDGMALRYAIVTKKPVEQGNCAGAVCATKMGLNRPGVSIEGCNFKVGPDPMPEVFQR